MRGDTSPRLYTYGQMLREYRLEEPSRFARRNYEDFEDVRVLNNKRALIEQMEKALDDRRDEVVDEGEEVEVAEEESSSEEGHSSEQAVSDRKYRYRVALDTKGQFELLWDIDPPIEKIHFRLVADVKKSDVLAFGFSDYGETENADVVVMWTDYRGHHRFQVTFNCLYR